MEVSSLVTHGASRPPAQHMPVEVRTCPGVVSQCGIGPSKRRGAGVIPNRRQGGVKEGLSNMFSEGRVRPAELLMRPPGRRTIWLCRGCRRSWSRFACRSAVAWRSSGSPSGSWSRRAGRAPRQPCLAAGGPPWVGHVCKSPHRSAPVAGGAGLHAAGRPCPAPHPHRGGGSDAAFSPDRGRDRGDEVAERAPSRPDGRRG
jgi:hypothetical protein